MSKQIYLKNSKEKLVEGIDLYTDAVKSTLGPSGKFVIINNADGSDPFATKDGATVGSSIDHSDPVVNTGIQLIKKVTTKTDFDNGDGTTTASVLCRELIVLGMELKTSMKSFSEHIFRQNVKRELENIFELLDEKSIVLPLSEIKKVAFTSSNNDHEIADLFQKAFDNTGKDGYINIVESVDGKSYVDIIKGYVLDLGYMDRKFANNPISGFFEAKKCRVVLYDNEFTDRKEMIKMIERFPKNGTLLPTIIFAKDFSKDVLNVVDFNNGENKICLIKNQLRNEEYDNLINDIHNYTGAEPIKYFDEFDTQFGEAFNVIVKQGYTIFGEPEGTQKEILDDYIHLIELAAKEEKQVSYSLQMLRRVDKMKNGITTFYVGGDSEIEIKEKLHRVQDAYRACKAALNGKVIIGGGQSLVLLSKDFNDCNEYELAFHRMLRKPFKEILQNSFHDNIDEIREKISFEQGYNAKTRQFENLYETGIIDPVDGIKNYLRNAVSIALTVLSTECLIVETHNN